MFFKFNSVAPSALRVFILIFLFVCYGIQASNATGTVPIHEPYQQGLHHTLYKRNGSTITNGSMSLHEAKDIISRFHKVMAPANSRILKNPRTNHHTLLNRSELVKAPQKPPPLDYGGSNNSTSQYTRRIKRQSSLNQTASTNSSSLEYSIPPEVVEAARIMAEASPPVTTSDDYGAMIASLKAKYAPTWNATNVMPQKLQRPSGLEGYVPTDELPEIISNGTILAETGITERDTTTFWQETIQKLGTSPFAPSGYQVWRNVKDYGAKGDGVTDDTAAIQLAISSGGRCGASCGSSTIYPATVYFPSGTYLVSSSIIQYYNTEILGNPLSLPKIVASSSFVGLGVISSDFYTGGTSEWYINTNNFLRSIRNLIIDVTATPQNAAVCGIHWQVAQASSLENIYFYMTDPATNSATTQQGIYMENGSGGFLADLYFIGGKFGAFMGNQQFTASGLWFQNAQTGLQISWDWGWTLQNLVFENCGTGITVVGGASGAGYGQGVGSLAVTDVVMLNVNLGISTSLYADNSTSFIVSNSVFDNVPTVILDSHANVVLLPGQSGNTVMVDSWGFGQVTNATGQTGFVNGKNIASTIRAIPLVYTGDPTADQPFFFTRRRPDYSTLGNSQLMDVKAYGAKGDGSSDDTVILNHILDVAANISAIVYFPYGVYMISDTLNVPVGSRIIGQAWPQIMATGSAFGNMANPHVAIKVGATGSVGPVEIQCMLFTVKGATAGAVLMEWNVHESTQGSAGLWDSHFRVGGAIGSNLQLAQCPTASQNSGCIAASLMLHVTQKASAYLENVWMWAADHDMDKVTQDQINVFSARGCLIESQGPTWLWGTSVEHNVLYQYQLSGAKNVFMGLIQTESPYFQTVPAAPAPFQNNLIFPDDPTFSNCAGGSLTCAFSWGVRMIDSSTIYVLSTGLYSWFQDYSQTCINNGLNNCQDSNFYIEQSYDVWIYNLITIGAVQMISPFGGNPIIAAQNRNGYASSILAWLGGANQTAGSRNLTGYQLYTLDNLTNTNFPSTCKTALTATIKCDPSTSNWTMPSYHGPLGNTTLASLACDASCGQSLSSWYNGVNTNCAGYTWSSGAALSMFGGYIWYGYNETCQKAANGSYCSDIIDNFSYQTSLSNMPTSELCSSCFLGRLQMMQKSPFSIFNVISWYQSALTAAISACSYAGPISTMAPPIPVPTNTPWCVSGNYYLIKSTDTCDSIALAKGVSSASIFFGNPSLTNCTNLPAGLELCLPLSCATYTLQANDSCISASYRAGINDITKYNTWINIACDNLHNANNTMGSVLCASPAGGTYVPGTATNTSLFPGSDTTGYGTTLVAPPSGATVAPGSVLACGGWYTVVEGDTCASVTLNAGISLSLFAMVNPSVNQTSCTNSLIVGDAYCIAPLRSTIYNDNDYTYGALGCWSNSDPSSTVLLDDNLVNSTMTVEMCSQYCNSEEYDYFGIQNSTDCLCGFEISVNSAQVASSMCNMACPGNSVENCGGSKAVSLFGPVNDTLSFQYSSMGCWSDSTAYRTLYSASLLGKKNNSIEACAAFCLPTYSFFGVEGGSDCWCGVKISSHATLLNDTSCNTNCSGTPDEVCGGSSAIQVYAVSTSFTIASTSTIKSSTSTSKPLSTTSHSSSTISKSASASTASSTSHSSTSSRSSSSVTPSTSLSSRSATPSSTSSSKATSSSSIKITSSSTSSAKPSSSSSSRISLTSSLSSSSLTSSHWTSGSSSKSSTSTSSSKTSSFSSSSKASSSSSSSKINSSSSTSRTSSISSTSSTSSSATATPTGTYQGCFTEGTSTRALNSATYVNYTTMTIEICAGFCRPPGYAYFGVEYGGECYCGNTLQAGSANASTQTDCNMACDGNAAEICGGPNRLSLYLF